MSTGSLDSETDDVLGNVSQPRCEKQKGNLTELHSEIDKNNVENKLVIWSTVHELIRSISIEDESFYFCLFENNAAYRDNERENVLTDCSANQKWILV